MQSANLLHINLPQVAQATEGLDVRLTDRFFADLGQEEISGGNVCVKLLARPSADYIYNVSVEVKGTVVVACDRCLDPLTLSVDTKEVLKVKDAEPAENDNAEMLYTEANGNYIDLSWTLYEIIETSLPIGRFHPEGECNKEMLDYIISEEDDENEDAEV